LHCLFDHFIMQESQRTQIRILDTTLRDGEQSPGCSMSLESKLLMSGQLDRLGVDVIEAGFPVTCKGEFEAVQAIANQVRRPIIAALARARREDIDIAWQSLHDAARSRIHVFLPVSDIHLKHKLGISRFEAIKKARESIRYAKGLCDDIEFSPEDATRADLTFLCSIVEAVIEEGATTVNIPDTVGYATPIEITRIIGTIRERVRSIDSVTISIHCHDDLGLAVANSIAAIEAGALQVECTINGIGERAGNASLEEIIMLLHVRADILPYRTSIITEQLYPSSQLLTQITGIKVQPNKAIVGSNAFSHEAGIHQHGIIKNPLTYEIMTPQSVGASETRLVLGKHSGRHALAHRYEQLGYNLLKYQLDCIYSRYLELIEQHQPIHDQILLDLVHDEVQRQRTRRNHK
jgi:2-isopropylmalate synthase